MAQNLPSESNSHSANQEILRILRSYISSLSFRFSVKILNTIFQVEINIPFSEDI